MKLRSLLSSIEIDYDSIENIPELEISGLHFHSERISKNYLFIAITGNDTDGHHYISDAIKAGASVVIGEQDLRNIAVPYIKVTNSRLALAQLAKAYYGDPADKRIVIGITGTNGKTTTSYMLRHILEEAGVSCALIGSVAYIINGEVQKSINTTPDPLTIHELIQKSRDDVIIIEVSSHGLHQGRVDGLLFDYSIFTNLSHDHLNYHRTLLDYFETKAKLFSKLKDTGDAIISSYNEWGRKLIRRLTSQEKKVFSVGYGKENSIQIKNVMINQPTTFDLVWKNELFSLELKHYGLHNVWNASLVFMTALRMGINPQQIIASIGSFSGVPGRFETFRHPRGATVIVDYAHNPEALVHCFQTMKKIGAKRIIHIFGFRGKGDPSKRKEMVTISSASADRFILTLDDLEQISSEEMMWELEQLCDKSNGKVIEDRTLAIEYAWQNAANGDWILITGKGPEEYTKSYTLPTMSDKDTIYFLANHHDMDRSHLIH